jgi:peptidoglycan glycosyltransferase
VIDVSNGEVLALVSRPTFDPNTLDADWDQLESHPAAPLLNRTTQGLYQPGGALQLVVLAAALEAEVAELDAPVGDPVERVMLGERALDCAREPQGLSLAQAVAAACPAPLADLGKDLGTQRLEVAFRLWGLDVPPSLEITTEAGEAQVTDPRLAAMGQETLTVTPLHMARVVAALGNDGVMPPSRLVLKSQRANGQWQPPGPQGPAVRVLSPDLAEPLRALLQPADGEVLGHSSLALAGADLPFHVWFLGLAPSQAPRYAVAVLLEHGGTDGLTLADQIGRDALLAALAQTP